MSIPYPRQKKLKAERSDSLSMLLAVSKFFDLNVFTWEKTEGAGAGI
jgi:hypothetical protein